MAFTDKRSILLSVLRLINLENCLLIKKTVKETLYDYCSNKKQKTADSGCVVMLNTMTDTMESVQSSGRSSCLDRSITSTPGSHSNISIQSFFDRMSKSERENAERLLCKALIMNNIGFK